MSFSLPALANYKLSFPTQLIGRGYRVESREKGSGKLVAESRIRIGRTGNYVFIEGRATSEFGGKKIESVILRYFTLENGLATIYFISGEVSRENRPWQSYTNRFDWGNNLAVIDHFDREKNERKVKSVKLAEKLITVGDLDLLAESFPDQGQRSDTIKVMGPDGATFGLMVRLAEGEEKIGGVTCYRIEMKLDLGLFSFIMPKFNFWVTVAKPHRFVRYTGPSGGPGSPEIEQNIVR